MPHSALPYDLPVSCRYVATAAASAAVSSVGYPDHSLCLHCVPPPLCLVFSLITTVLFRLSSRHSYFSITLKMSLINGFLPQLPCLPLSAGRSCSSFCPHRPAAGVRAHLLPMASLPSTPPVSCLPVWSSLYPPLAERKHPPLQSKPCLDFLCMVFPDSVLEATSVLVRFLPLCPQSTLRPIQGSHNSPLIVSFLGHRFEPKTYTALAPMVQCGSQGGVLT